MNCPGQTCNVDETGVPLDHKTSKCHCKKRTEKSLLPSLWEQEANYCCRLYQCSWSGNPSFRYLRCKCLNHDWTDGEVPGTTYGLSSNGWMDSELCHGWLTNHFLKHAVGSRPLLLLLDGHTSHYNPATIRFAKEHNVIVLCLPPHTTHESQPLNTCVWATEAKLG